MNRIDDPLLLLFLYMSKEGFDKLLDLKDKDLPTSTRCLTAQELSMG